MSVASRKRAEYGATMVEFAVVAAFVFGLFGLILDFGLLLFDYSILTHVTQAVARKSAATEYPKTCDEIQANTCKLRCEKLNSLGYLGNWADSFAVKIVRKVDINSPMLDPNCSLMINSRKSNSCFFCIFPQSVANVRTQSIQAVEDRGFCESIPASGCDELDCATVRCESEA